MTESLTDILAAIAQAQPFKLGMTRANQEQRWRLAWERANEQSEWVMQATESRAEGGEIERSYLPAADADFARAAPEGAVTPPTNERPSTAAVRGLGGAPGAGAGHGAQHAASGVATQSAAMAGHTGLTEKVAAARPAQVTPSRPVAEGWDRSSAPEPRSVKLFLRDGSVQVVIRDATLEGATLPKLVSRVRRLVAAHGQRVNEVIVNGRVEWADAGAVHAAVDQAEHRIIEIFL